MRDSGRGVAALKEPMVVGLTGFMKSCPLGAAVYSRSVYPMTMLIVVHAKHAMKLQECRLKEKQDGEDQFLSGSRSRVETVRRLLGVASAWEGIQSFMAAIAESDHTRELVSVCAPTGAANKWEW